MVNCNSVREGLGPVKPMSKLNTQYLAGPGSALKYIFVSRYRTPGCGGCHTTAREMDKDGPDKVLEKLTEYAEKIHTNAQGRKWTRLLDFVDYTLFGLIHYESLIREAVQLHRDEIEKRDGPPPQEG